MVSISASCQTTRDTAGHPPCTHLLNHIVPRSILQTLGTQIRGIPQRSVTSGDIYAHLNDWWHTNVPSSVSHAAQKQESSMTTSQHFLLNSIKMRTA